MKANGTLESSHTDSWHAVWDAGRVDILGNSFLSTATYSALYYILSAMPTVEERTWPFVGLSPADLAHNVPTFSDKFNMYSLSVLHFASFKFLYNARVP